MYSNENQEKDWVNYDDFYNFMQYQVRQFKTYIDEGNELHSTDIERISIQCRKDWIQKEG